MLTVISYVLLRYYLGAEWTGWLLLLPVLLDLTLIEWMGLK